MNTHKIIPIVISTALFVEIVHIDKQHEHVPEPYYAQDTQWASIGANSSSITGGMNTIV